MIVELSLLLVFVILIYVLYCIGKKTKQREKEVNEMIKRFSHKQDLINKRKNQKTPKVPTIKK